jgi:hypothetical protein
MPAAIALPKVLICMNSARGNTSGLTQPKRPDFYSLKLEPGYLHPRIHSSSSLVIFTPVIGWPGRD